MKRKSIHNSNTISSSGDLSDKTIIVLLLLVVLVSIISVVVYVQVLNAVSNRSTEVVEADSGPAEAQGTVSLQIIAPPQQEANQASGQVN